ncbi:MAG: hypothetical protein QM731_14090 [Chitinophagaceae bacterium]
MNQVFSFNRWLLLVNKHWSENRKRYLLSLGGVAALLIIWFGFSIIINNHRPMHEDLQALTYFVGLVLVGCFFASMMFSDLSSKSKGIEFLILPSSLMEKLACMIFYSVFLFFICYTLVFYGVDIIMVKLSNSLARGAWEKGELLARERELYIEKIANVFVFNSEDLDKVNVNYYVILAFIVVQSAFLMGSVYFPKYSFLKTLISLLVIIVVMVIIMAKVAKYVIPERVGFYEGLTSLRLYNEDYTAIKVARLPEWISDSLLFLIKYAFAPVFWLITYFRLKEKQI